MAGESGNQAPRQIRTLYTLGSVGALSDAQLVERFLGRDGPDREDAFAALVRRHGPMVLGVCRRMLRGSAEAEDAFQAVFLVLARRAGAVWKGDGLKSWLYGVAVRTAKEARRRAARRRAREGGAMDQSRAVAAPDEGRSDLLALLDEELDRLPGRYRDPLMLCELEGVSRRDAAQRLGLPEGTLSSRLSRGRSLLRDRLARRGAALGTGTLAALLADPAGAAPPETLVAGTVRLALSSAVGAVPAALLARTAGRTASPWAKAIPTAVLAGGVLAVALVGWVIASGGPTPVNPDTPKPATALAPVAELGPEDPLPAGATLRFGSPRFRHMTRIEDLALSPDGRIAVANSRSLNSGALSTYDLATGRPLRTLDRSGDVEAVAFSPDGKTLATTGTFGGRFSVHLYDAATGEETARIPLSASSHLIGYTPDERDVVVWADGGKALHRIGLATGEVVRAFPNAGTVFAAALSPDGKHLVAGGYDYEGGGDFARQWEMDTGRELDLRPIAQGGFRSVAYSPDGATLAVGGESGKDASVTLVEAASGRELRKIPFPDASLIGSVAFSPDGRTLAASGGSSTRLFDVDTGRERLVIDRKAIGLRFSPDGTTLVGAVAGAIYRWDAATGRPLIPEGGESPVAQIAVTPDGKRVVTRGQDGDAQVWDARTGEYLRRVSVRWQRGCALSPDGRFLVWPVADEAIEFPSADMPGSTRIGSRLRMMDVATGEVDERFEGFAGDAHEIFFAPDGRTLVTAERFGQEASVRVWDVATGKVAREFAAMWKPSGRVWRSRPSPDGKILAVIYQGEMRGASVESEVKLWDIATGEEVAGPTPPWFDPEVMAFAPDGKTMAVVPSPFGMTIQFRDVATGRLLGEFRGPPGRVTALAYGPDWRLFTGAQDGTVLTWGPRAVDPPPAGRK